MKPASYQAQDPAWTRDQTARIVHRHTLAGKHFALDVDGLLWRLWRLQDRDRGA